MAAIYEDVHARRMIPTGQFCIKTALGDFQVEIELKGGCPKGSCL